MMDFGYPQTTETKILQECVLSHSEALADHLFVKYEVGSFRELLSTLSFIPSEAFYVDMS